MRAALILSVPLLMAAATAWAQPRHLSYDIRKDGDLIGREDVRIETHGDMQVVEVETHTRATILFLDFVFDHSRREEWRDGRLSAIRGETNDDGTRSKLDGVRGEEGWTVTVNGVAQSRPADSLPATLWTAKVLDAASLFGTIDAAPYAITVVPLGEERLEVTGAAAPARHYRLNGDLERDLWYGADGTLLKAAFKRKGFPIEYIRIAR